MREKGKGKKNREGRVVGDSQSPREKDKGKKVEKKQRGESCWRRSESKREG